MLSLVVSTRDRGERLADFFTSLRRLQPPPGGWELIMVDNGSSDGTGSAIRAFAATGPCAVRPVYTGTPGLSHARNAGLRHAAGQIVAFTDDDCYPRADYLCALVEVFQRHQAGVVGGRVVLHDDSDARVGVKDVAMPFEIPPHSFVKAGVIHGANMAVRREVLETIGGFDPLLGAGSACKAGEDTDFIARAVWAGWSARYDPKPVVAHHHGRKPGSAEDRQRASYDWGRGAYYARWMLEPRARRAYLGEWYYSMRSMAKKKRFGPVLREVAGASRYLADRLMSTQTIPRFDRPA